MGSAAFVSHQWVGKSHPDPEFKQLRVLQDAIHHMLSNMKHIPLDQLTESLVPGSTSLDLKAMKARPLFIWYDYFSCPQLESHIPDRVVHQMSNLDQAISSIPAYVSRSTFFFALCPVVDSESQDKVFTQGTWASRGWCKFEAACRELSPDSSWILIKSRTDVTLIATPLASIAQSPGEGAFTVELDRRLLAPIMLQAIRRKLHFCLRREDFVSYRVLLSLQKVHLRGFQTKPLVNLIPGYSAPELAVSESARSVSHFLYQYGFSSVRAVDSQGWAPLHYAALAGDATLIGDLLEQRVDLNCVTKKDQHLAGMPPFASALVISASFNHNESVRLLLSCKARPGGLLQPAMVMAALANNAAAIRMLCESGCSPNTKDVLGFSAFEAACGFGNLDAAREIIRQGGDTVDISRGLYCGMTNRGGTAELVEFLLSLRADVNHQFRLSSMTCMGRLLVAGKTLQHRFGKQTMGSKASYHGQDVTPLMVAVMSGQYEGAAALLAAGARTDLRNSRKKTVADFAEEQALPRFLQDALEDGLNRVDVQRIASAALANSYFEV
ncbi:Ank3 [Symbiodinium sp. CCMP2456]|nr:Ank3 [Symbiodinium sp. CCMP2456]